MPVPTTHTPLTSFHTQTCLYCSFQYSISSTSAFSCCHSSSVDYPDRLLQSHNTKHTLLPLSAGSCSTAPKPQDWLSSSLIQISANQKQVGMAERICHSDFGPGDTTEIAEILVREDQLIFIRRYWSPWTNISAGPKSP